MRLDPRIREMLDACGLSWEVVNRRRHYQLVLRGRVIHTFPHGNGSGKDVGRRLENSRACVRRAIVAALAEVSLYRDPDPG